MSQPPDVWVIGAKRTPIGTFRGTLRGFTAVDLGVSCARAAMEQAGGSPEQIDEAVVGHVHETAPGSSVARHIALRLGVPVTSPALTVNRACASGFQAVIDAAKQIRIGEAKIVLAGGAEALSLSPRVKWNT